MMTRRASLLSLLTLREKDCSVTLRGMWAPTKILLFLRQVGMNIFQSFISIPFLCI
jgi:hypothetical protein